MVRRSDQIARRRRQPIVARDVPEKGVRVEQQSHRPSNPASTSSDSGAVNSSGTRNSPASLTGVNPATPAGAAYKYFRISSRNLV